MGARNSWWWGMGYCQGHGWAIGIGEENWDGGWDGISRGGIFCSLFSILPFVLSGNPFLCCG